MSTDATRWTVPGVLTLWCAALVVLRVELSGSLFYVFLVWNLFLAWIPWLAAQAFGASSRRRAPRLLRLGWFTLWLLFLPNAPYILTDLLHLRPRPPVPLWYDLALLLSCAGTGLLLGYISLLEVQGAVEKQLGRVAGWMVAAGSLFLSGFGIYLGRFLRRNSWEILTDPAGLYLDISDRLLNPTLHLRTYGVTLVFGVGLLLWYIALRVVMVPRSQSACGEVVFSEERPTALAHWAKRRAAS
jgi:uncharacterized membrane protein